MGEALFTTPRLVLRRWRDSDLALWLDHLNTPQVRACLGGVQSPDAVAERFATMRDAWDAEGMAFLAVERRSDAMFVGTCGLSAIAGDRPPPALRGATQVGWQLRADCWGHGYATEAARAMLEHAFRGLGCAVIHAQTSERNAGSWRVMQRLGMERQAGLDYDDPDYPAEDNPTMVWSLTRERWPAAAHADRETGA